MKVSVGMMFGLNWREMRVGACFLPVFTVGVKAASDRTPV